jgi:hypothetical protein
MFSIDARTRSGHKRQMAAAMRRKLLHVGAAVIALSLAACVQSEKPLLSDGKPTLGQKFEAHLYERVAGSKAFEFNASTYKWKDGKYVPASGFPRDIASFTYQPLEGSDFLVQAADSQSLFTYWIARKITDGAYLIFPLNEYDSDVATRQATCGKDQGEGPCLISTHEQLLTLARATAAAPLDNPSLGVILTK